MEAVAYGREKVRVAVKWDRVEMLGNSLNEPLTSELAFILSMEAIDFSPR
jgi:hypothetical protein